MPAVGPRGLSTHLFPKNPRTLHRSRSADGAWVSPREGARPTARRSTSTKSPTDTPKRTPLSTGPDASVTRPTTRTGETFSSSEISVDAAFIEAPGTGKGVGRCLAWRPRDAPPALGNALQLLHRCWCPSSRSSHRLEQEPGQAELKSRRGFGPHLAAWTASPLPAVTFPDECLGPRSPQREFY